MHKSLQKKAIALQFVIAIAFFIDTLPIKLENLYNTTSPVDNLYRNRAIYY